MTPRTHKLLTAAGTYAARPVAFLVLIVYAIAWYVFDRESLDYHGLTALVTLCMTLFIQRAEHRDTQALHAKLDELLRLHDRADNAITHIDEKEPEAIERERERSSAK